MPWKQFDKFFALLEKEGNGDISVTMRWIQSSWDDGRRYRAAPLLHGELIAICL